ncbi:MAG: hypothetical protein K2N06_06740 [Oscillospiraceae bacterium]|nr:hypothetical protein [Oscillospiraceae bacterium]
MSQIFNEQNMIRSLSGSIPEGETFVAGICANAKETAIIRVYSNCVPVFDSNKHVDYILPAIEDGKPLDGAVTFKVTKKKYAEHSVYICITQNYLVLTECSENMHYYEFDIVKSSPFAVDLTERLDVRDIKYVFPFDDIQDVTIKKGIFGSLKCNITIKDGSYFKLMFPKRNGLGGGMPYYDEYREKICDKLNSVKSHS